MNDKQRNKISRFLSKHLRHTPEAIGLSLEPGGWVEVELLLQACASHGMSFTRAELEDVVATNDKQRFAFDETSQRIRASQGHSIKVDLQLQVQKPPAVLYHGTGSQSVRSIEKSGLKKMSRHHVHLSSDVVTAKRVGTRHGYPAIFEVDTATMNRDDFKFFCSDNGVWLVDHVPSKYLTRIE